MDEDDAMTKKYVNVRGLHSGRASFARRGMTLIEVMIAIVILSGAMLGLAKFGANFEHTTATASDMSLASDLAVARVEQIKAYRVYTSLVATYNNITETYPGRSGLQWLLAPHQGHALRGMPDGNERLHHGDRDRQRTKPCRSYFKDHHHRGVLMQYQIRGNPAMNTTPARPSNRAGFTLIEMMMAVLLTMLVFAITIPFFRNQTRALDGGAGRLDAQQNARYAQSAIDREVRLAGGVTASRSSSRPPRSRSRSTSISSPST